MAFGADRSVKVVLKAEVSDFIGKMTSASKATQSFGKDAVAQAGKHKQSFDMVGKGLLASGAAIGAGLGLAVKKFADFDQAMSAAAAASGATGASLGALRDLAIKAGADTQYSATEAAQGITEMAKAGISAKDIMGGGLTGALSLAAAGQMDVGAAAEAAASAMNQFGLAGSQMGHIADDLSNGANAAQGSVADMSQALNQTGVVASSFGMSLDDTVTTLTMFAKAGMTGSDAGTSMKTMIQRLAAPTDQAKGLMDQLGLSVYDATGKFVGMSNFSGQLKTSLASYTDEAKNSALATIFGADAVRGATIAAKNGAEGFDALATQVTKIGGASEQAAKLTDNLKGDIERLGGSIDTALIQGGSAANGVLRTLTQGLTGAVNGIGSMGPAGTQAAVGLAAATSGVALLGGGALVMLPKIAEAQKAMVALGLTAGRTGTALKIAGGAFGVFAVAAGAVAIGSFASQAQIATVSTDGLAASLGNLNANAKSTELTKLFEGFNGKWGKDIDTTSQALEAFGISAYNALDQGWDARARRMTDFGTSQADFAKRTQQLDQALAQMVTSGNADGAAAALKQLTDAAAEQGVPVSETQHQFKLYDQAVAAAGQSAAGAAAGVKGAGDAAAGAAGPTHGLALSEADLAKKAQDAKRAHDNLIDSVENFGGVVLTARGAARDYQAALDGAAASLKENGKTLSTNTAKGRANQEALEGIATSALKMATANIENKKSLSSVSDGVAKARAQFLTFADRMGMSKKSAFALADQLGLTKGNVDSLKAAIDKVPASKNTKIGTPGSKESTSSVNTLRERIAALQGKLVKVLAEGAGDSAARVAQLRAEIAALQGKTVTVTTITRRLPGTDAGDVVGHGSRGVATGGAISGPGTGTSDDIPAWLSNGEHVLTAEDVKRAGGHEAIYAWRRSLGSTVRKFATGGAVGFAGGGEVDFSGIMAIVQAGAFSLDDLRSAQAKPGQVRADLKKAQDALKDLLARQEKNKRDLAAARANLNRLLHTRGASASSITSARNKVSDELAEQHKLLGQVATAEGKVTSTRNTLTAATNAASDAAAKYAKANRPLITRTIEAAGSRNKVTAKFLNNIRTLMARGFTSLARDLMNMGGPEAETLAAQAVKSTKDAKSLQSRLDASAKLDADAQALQDKLDGKTAPVWTGATTTYASGKKHVPNAVKGKSGGGVLTKGGVTVSIGNMNAVDADAAAQAIITAQRDAIAAFG